MFPRGAMELVEHFMHACDVSMSTQMSHCNFDGVAVNDRIRTGVVARLKPLGPLIRTWPEAMAVGALPQNLPYTLRLLGGTVDEIWYYAGDRSTDISWYTRRGLLLSVYASTGTASPARGDKESQETLYVLCACVCMQVLSKRT